MEDGQNVEGATVGTEGGVIGLPVFLGDGSASDEVICHGLRWSRSVRDFERYQAAPRSHYEGWQQSAATRPWRSGPPCTASTTRESDAAPATAASAALGD